MENETTFENAKVGDRVWWFNQRVFGGIVRKTDAAIWVAFQEYDTIAFNLNGERHGLQELFWDEILFVAPPRPKRMVKKTLEGWVNVYPDDSPLKRFHFVKDRPHADGLAEQTRIACVHVTGEYEVGE